MLKRYDNEKKAPSKSKVFLSHKNFIKEKSRI